MAGVAINELVVKYGHVVAVNGVSFRVEEGEFVTLLGPSGCGKTTTLRCIAGLERPASGSILIGDEMVAGPGRWVPPHMRGINMVFQSYAIWPHLSVFENVAYGLRIQRLPKDEIARRVSWALGLVGLSGYEHRYGTELSGGQQQRVAVARAVVTDPKVLLFDEPLSNLDAALRERMRFELVELQQQLGKTFIYVTHDQAEAMVISDRIILMNHGEIVQIGKPREMYEEPVNRFAAEFIGVTNFLTGQVAEINRSQGNAVVKLDNGLAVHAPLSSRVPVQEGSPSLLSVRPENVTIHTESPQNAPNTWGARVEKVGYLGNVLECELDMAGIRMRVQAHPSVSIKPGDDVFVRVDPDKLIWVPLDEDKEAPRAEAV